MTERAAIRLFQEDLRSEPYWMLVGCILVNRTRWKQAEPVFNALRSRVVSSWLILKIERRALRRMMEPLGFGEQRTDTLRRFSADLCLRYMSGRMPRTAEDVVTLPGCGGYAADSWAIFVEGRRDVEPDDAKLKDYLARTGMG